MSQRLKDAYDQATNRVPGLGDVDRAIATARRRWARRAIGAPIVVAALAVVVTVAVAMPWTDEAQTRPSVIEPPSASPDGNKHGPIVLDSIELDDGRSIDLVAWGGGEGPCLRITGIDGRDRECGNAPSELQPPVEAGISAQAIAQRSSSSPFEIYGATSSDVTRVVVYYGSNGQQQQQANMLRCTDQSALDQSGISEPFGYFFAELPADTTAPAVEAVAFGPDGHRLGSADFSFLRDQPLDALISGPHQR